MNLAIDTPAVLRNRHGMALHQAGRTAEAVAAYTAAISLHPAFADAYANRAAARGHLGEVREAFVDFATALRLNPNSPDALSNRGTLRRELGDLSAAMADFDRAIALEPEHADARANRAVIHHLRWNHAAAIEDLTQALSAPPGRYGIEARRHLLTVFRGDAYYHVGRTEDAMADYRSAFRSRPTVFARLVCRTIATTVRDHGAESMLADCDRHLARDPRDYLSLARRAVILTGLGRHAEAEEARTACYRFGDLQDEDLFLAILSGVRRRSDDP